MQKPLCVDGISKGRNVTIIGSAKFARFGRRSWKVLHSCYFWRLFKQIKVTVGKPIWYSGCKHRDGIRDRKRGYFTFRELPLPSVSGRRGFVVWWDADKKIQNKYGKKNIKLRVYGKVISNTCFSENLFWLSVGITYSRIETRFSIRYNTESICYYMFTICSQEWVLCSRSSRSGRGTKRMRFITSSYQRRRYVFRWFWT